MNTSASTNLTRPLTTGSTEAFLTGLAPDGTNNLLLNGSPWVLSSASVAFVDPDGNASAVVATGTNGGLTWTAAWPVPNTPGDWQRAWRCLDSAGNLQVSQPLPFKVIASPVG